jgi:hypothetical protein
VSCACAAYRFLISSSHAAVQYASWAGFASPARTKYLRMCALFRVPDKAHYPEAGIMPGTPAKALVGKD